MHLLPSKAHEHELAYLARRMKPDKTIETTHCQYIARYGDNKNTDAGVGQEGPREMREDQPNGSQVWPT